jgi:polyketide cyclase/dehydrase/lipid transport protein
VKRVLLFLLIVLIAIILVVVTVGALVPKQHTSTRAARFHQSPNNVWTAITDFDKFPTWRKEVARVESLPDVNGKPSWREYDRHGSSIPYQVMVMLPPKVLVVRIADLSLPFGGAWTYEISPAPDGTSLLRISEDGEIYNPVFRFVARFILGYSQTQERYLRALGAKFGESVAIEK